MPKTRKIGKAKKRKKRTKQKFFNRRILPIIEAKKEARELTSAKLKAGLKKIEIIPRRTMEVLSKKDYEAQKKGGGKG